MHPGKESTVLFLLVLMFMNASAAGAKEEIEINWDHNECRANPPESCGPGWYRLDSSRCVTVSLNVATFNEAEVICQNEGGNLLSISDEATLATLACILHLESPIINLHWVGTKRREHGSPEFLWTDGSGKLTLPFRDMDGSYDYMQIRVSNNITVFCSKSWALLMTAACEDERTFICQRKE